MIYLYILRTETKSKFTKVRISARPFHRAKARSLGAPCKMHIYCLYMFKDRERAYRAEKRLKTALSDKCAYGEFFNVYPGTAKNSARKIIRGRNVEIH